MQNPCTNCHKRHECQRDCFPRKDYLRGARKLEHKMRAPAEGQERKVRPDDINEALRLAVNALDIQNETVVCSVCGAVSIKYRKRTCVNKPLIGPPVMWDYMDCSNCGCQILLNRRYIDIDDLSVASDNTED